MEEDPLEVVVEEDPPEMVVEEDPPDVIVKEDPSPFTGRTSTGKRVVCLRKKAVLFV